jgi:glycine/D-amino acid oxidase-like deaminating enzyme
VIESPFWVADHPRPVGLGKDELPGETDYLIVGSGLTGLAAGLRLAASGATVTVVDSAEIAGGASSINGGMVSPDVKAGIRAVEASYGSQIANEIWHATVRSVELVVDLCRAHGIDASINRDGMAALGLTRRDVAKFEDTVRWYRERFGVEWEVLDAAGVDRIAGSDAFAGALFEPEGFGLHPARYSFGMAEALSRLEGRLVGNTEVTELTPSRKGMSVVTTSGKVDAGDVILATNGYTTERPSPELRRRIVPIGSYIIVTERLPAEQARAIFPANSMTYTKRRLLHYMRRTPDNRILIGGRRNLKTGLPLDESAADLRAALIRYFPDLAGRDVEYVWGGKLAVPFDLTPHMGRTHGAWYALGYAGHGVGLSTLLGHDLAGMLLGEEKTSPFAQIPHEGRFYYRGKPWFLSPASVLYRGLDKVGL